jgi:membrane protein required for colicin V production
MGERVNQVDALLLVLLTPFALLGYWRGLCREVLGLLGLLGGAIVAAAFGAGLAELLIAHQVPPALARPGAFAAIFLGIATAANLLGLVLDRVVRALFLGGVNRFAGVAFGAAKGAALLGFALLLAQQLIPASSFSALVRASRLAPPLMRIASTVLAAGRGFGTPAGSPQGQHV